MVNVASECGFTEEHYPDLQQLQRDFGPYHFNVLAFPCNQFGQQEPGSDRDIDSFIRRVYGVSFPLFSKIAVVGTGANNVYKYLVGEFEAELRDSIQASLKKTNLSSSNCLAAIGHQVAAFHWSELLLWQNRLAKNPTGTSGSI